MHKPVPCVVTSKLDYQPLFGKRARTPERAAEIEPTLQANRAMARAIPMV